MSSLLERRRAPSHQSEVEDVCDVDVTPVMNVLVILFPFLLSLAVFTHFSIIKFSLPPNVSSGLDQSAGNPKMKLTVVSAPKFTVITLGSTVLDSIPTGPKEYELLSAALNKRRSATEFKDQVIVAVRDRTDMQRVVSVMDRCRGAGFSDVALSSAPEATGGPK